MPQQFCFWTRLHIGVWIFVLTAELSFSLCINLCQSPLVYEQADILMQPELEALVHSSNGRFTVSHWLTQPSNDASSNHGQLLQHHSSSIGSSSGNSSGSNRGISELARSVLPQPASVTGEEAGSTMVRDFFIMTLVSSFFLSLLFHGWLSVFFGGALHPIV